MPYKVYNELPGVDTTAKTIISVIYYNVYNMMGWTPGTGANAHPWQYSLPDANGDTRRAQRQKNGLQKICRPGTAKTFYIIHCILQIPDRLPDI